MKLIKCTRVALVLQESTKEHAQCSVIFELGIVPLSPTPGRIDILPPRKSMPRLRMTWKKFGREKCLRGKNGEPDIVLIPRDHFRSVEAVR